MLSMQGMSYTNNGNHVCTIKDGSREPNSLIKTIGSLFKNLPAVMDSVNSDACCKTTCFSGWALVPTHAVFPEKLFSTSSMSSIGVVRNVYLTIMECEKEE